VKCLLATFKRKEIVGKPYNFKMGKFLNEIIGVSPQLIQKLKTPVGKFYIF